MRSPLQDVILRDLEFSRRQVPERGSTQGKSVENKNKMKVVLLAAGYGTRMERDVRQDQSGKWHHLQGVPKPLLPVGKYPLITHWMHTLEGMSEITGVYVMTNAVNHGLFEEWRKAWPHVQLISDGSISNETRSGSVSCMNLAITQCNVQEDVMIVAGDTLFYDDFKFSTIIQKLEDFRKIDKEANMLLYTTCPEEEVHKHGIVETDQEGRVVGFLEKPHPSETTSRKQCPCFYILSPSAFPLLNQFLEEKKDEPLESRDASGTFITYLYQKLPTFAAQVSGRFDVGGLQSYITCHEYFLSKAEAL